MIENGKIADNDVVQITTENIDYKSNNSSLFNTVNSITASGILAIPFALNLAGFIPGILFIILVWKISQFNFERLTMISSETQTHSFKSIVHIFYGKNLSIISEISIIWYTMSNLIARYIILDQFIIKIFEYGINIHPHVLEKLWMLKFGIYFVFLPMSLMANLKTIKFASYLSLICIPISVFIVVYSLLTHEKFYLHLYNIKLFNFQPQMFMAFGLIVMSFCGHFNLPKIYQELEDRNPKKMNFIIKVSTTICFITYLVIGVSGYIMFEDATVGNVINNYPTNSLLALITRLCLTASLLFSTPFVVASNRRSLCSLLLPKEKKLNWYEYAAMTTAILSFSCFVSLFISRSEIVFSISGGTIGAFLMFVLPGLFLFKNIHSKQVILNQDTKSYEYTTISTRSGWLMVSIGIVFGALCISGTIFSILSIK